MIDVGQQLPGVELLNTELKRIDLSSIKKPALIAFFPGAFTSVCTKEMCTFRDNLQRLSSLNADIVAISVDSPFSNRAFKDKNNLSFMVLSDYDRRAVKTFGIELHDFAQMKGYTAAKRSVFIVDKQGRISYKWVSDDPTVEPNYQALMEEIAKIS